MTDAKHIAKATRMNSLHGDSHTIEVVSQDGRAISSLVRMTYECSHSVDEGTLCKIQERFHEFVEGIEGLF